MRLYLYHLKNLIKTKELLFWTMAFPIILGTLFFAAFGNAKMEDNFSRIPVGVVIEGQADAFEAVIKGISVEGEVKNGKALKSNSKKDTLFTIYYLSKEEAKKELKKESIKAYMFVKSDEDITLFVDKSDIISSIVETFLNEYKAQMSAIQMIFEENPERAAKIGQKLMNKIYGKSEENFIVLKEESVSGDKYNPYINYFYALIAMTCLFGSMFSQKGIKELQADQSALGVRRNAAPTKKMTMLFIDVMAALTIQFVEIVIAFIYFIGILKIDFGGKIVYMLIMSAAGIYVGNSIGMFIGTVVKGNSAKKEGIMLAVNLLCCHFAGLMFGDMLNIMEQHAPWFNRINPAALIANAFHSLAIYNSLEPFFMNVVILLIIGTVLNVFSIAIIRRKKYASI